MTHLLALDQGTTSSRALVFDDAGRVVAVAQREITQHYPQPGWVEHDPTQLWTTQLAVAREALARARLGPGDVAAIGIANQRETTVVWDRRTGEPVHRAIVWQDRRTATACDRWRADGAEPQVQQVTGLRLDPYFSASKVAWILEHVPGARMRAERGELAFGTVDSWLLWQLTGGEVHATDPTNASRTLLWDLRAETWSAPMLARFGVPPAMLPQVLPSSGTFGATRPALLGAPIAIRALVGDQQAALAGQACFAAGMAKNTYGTGCFALLATGESAPPPAHGLLATAAARLGAGPPAYALEGSVFVAGAVVQWLRDALGLIRSASEVEALARSVPDTGGVVFVPAFTGLGAPHWDAHARGALFGLTRGTGAAHVARAALESIAMQSAELLAAMHAAHGAPLAELRVDGGAAANDLLMQLQADMIGVPVVRPKVLETTALGAACLAGLAAGVWRDAPAFAAQWRADRCFEPAMSRDEAQARMQVWSRAVARARGWADEAP